MKIGSLVECINDDWKPTLGLPPNPPKKGDVFVVSDVYDILHPVLYLALHEIPDWYFQAEHFRELQPPVDLSELIENINKVPNGVSV